MHHGKCRTSDTSTAAHGRDHCDITECCPGSPRVSSYGKWEVLAACSGCAGRSESSENSAGIGSISSNVRDAFAAGQRTGDFAGANVARDGCRGKRTLLSGRVDMRSSTVALLAAFQLFTSVVMAGGPGLTRTAYRGGATPVQSASSCDCGAPAASSCGCAAAPVVADPCCKPRCCVPVLPAIVGALDSTLHRIFSNPCNPPCCRPARPCRPSCATVWNGYQPSCGCDSGAPNWSPHNENPFIEDELHAPPAAPKDAAAHRYKPKAQAVHHHKAPRTAAVAPLPPVVSVQVAEESPSPTPAKKRPSQVVSDREVQPVSHVESKRAVPRNPLRPE